MSEDDVLKAIEELCDRWKNLKVPTDPSLPFENMEEFVEWYQNRPPFGWREKHSKEVADLNKRFQIRIAKKHQLLK